MGLSASSRHDDGQLCEQLTWWLEPAVTANQRCRMLPTKIIRTHWPGFASLIAVRGCDGDLENWLTDENEN